MLFQQLSLWGQFWSKTSNFVVSKEYVDQVTYAVIGRENKITSSFHSKSPTW
uniref:Uncharacterized protein n=1 Tax=Arundo donax TaxID=35708 RepID=A0A0A8XVS8_ARUDO